MSSMKRVVVCGLCLLLSAPAAAQTLASFDVPLQGTILGGGAVLNINSISLPASGSPNFAFTFLLPRNYVNNSEVTVSLFVAPAIGSSPCSFRIAPMLMTRRRAGTFIVNSIDGVSVGNAIVNFSSDNDINKNIKIAPAGLLTDLKRGDAITLQIRRDAAHAMDTCSSAIFVGGIDIRYSGP